jgi:flagellar FliL protein
MAASDATPAKKKGSLKATLLEFLLVTILAAAAGAGLAIINPAPMPGPLAKPGGPVAIAAAACGPTTTDMADLPPVVTNIGSPADIWVRMEASIVFDGKSAPSGEVMAAEIAADELAYLRTVTLAQMQGPIGLENIRQDLADRAITRSGGKVSEFILRTLVVQ